MNKNFYFHNLLKPDEHFQQDIIFALSSQPKHLPTKFLYDARGSQLFDEICKVPEYYITRTETAILQNNIKEITKVIGDNKILIELGSGSSDKIRHLLPYFKNIVYMPVDISGAYLERSAKTLSLEFPMIPIHAVCLDYSHDFIIPFQHKDMHKVFVFLGSSISNFEPDATLAFLKCIINNLQPSGGLLIGVDLKKDKKIIDAAYNDKQGITAAFNLNILTRLNRELKAEFLLENFIHQAFYRTDYNRIEMHLVSNQEQTVRIRDQLFHFRALETIHTENSYKFTVEEIQQIAFDAGFTSAKLWIDEAQLFSLHYFEF